MDENGFFEFATKVDGLLSQDMEVGEVETVSVRICVFLDGGIRMMAICVFMESSLEGPGGFSHVLSIALSALDVVDDSTKAAVFGFVFGVYKLLSESIVRFVIGGDVVLCEDALKFF